MPTARCDLIGIQELSYLEPRNDDGTPLTLSARAPPKAVSIEINNVWVFGYRPAGKRTRLIRLYMLGGTDDEKRVDRVVMLTDLQSAVKDAGMPAIELECLTETKFRSLSDNGIDFMSMLERFDLVHFNLPAVSRLVYETHMPQKSACLTMRGLGKVAAAHPDLGFIQESINSEVNKLYKYGSYADVVNHHLKPAILSNSAPDFKRLLPLICLDPYASSKTVVRKIAAWLGSDIANRPGMEGPVQVFIACIASSLLFAYPTKL